MRQGSAPPVLDYTGLLDSPRSLEDVHGTVDIPIGQGSTFRRLFAFVGPAYMVSVGYMDPGNWGTDLQGGASYRYGLLWVVALSSLIDARCPFAQVSLISSSIGIFTKSGSPSFWFRATYARRIDSKTK